MQNILSTMNRFLRLVISLLVLALLTIAGWFGFDLYLAPRWKLEETEKKLAASAAELDEAKGKLVAKEREIGQLNAELKRKQEQIERLELSMRLLKVERRVARVDVVNQSGTAAAGDLKTTVRFVELGPGDKPIDAPREFVIPGDMIYVDSLVIKFQDKLIEGGDSERGASICLFQRVFGETQSPKDGFSLDPVGSAPMAYRGGKPASALEQELWTRFWEYANNPKAAEKQGVRAAHGEAPSMKLKPGKSYRLLLRSSGGLSFETLDAPAKQ